MLKIDPESPNDVAQVRACSCFPITWRYNTKEQPTPSSLKPHPHSHLSLCLHVGGSPHYEHMFHVEVEPNRYNQCWNSWFPKIARLWTIRQDTINFTEYDMCYQCSALTEIRQERVLNRSDNVWCDALETLENQRGTLWYMGWGGECEGCWIKNIKVSSVTKLMNVL